MACRAAPNKQLECLHLGTLAIDGCELDLGRCGFSQSIAAGFLRVHPWTRSIKTKPKDDENYRLLLLLRDNNKPGLHTRLTLANFSMCQSNWLDQATSCRTDCIEVAAYQVPLATEMLKYLVPFGCMGPKCIYSCTNFTFGR